jgi:hypothetical protein
MALARQGDAQQALSEYGKGRAIIVQLKPQAPDIAALAHAQWVGDAELLLERYAPERQHAKGAIRFLAAQPSIAPLEINRLGAPAPAPAHAEDLGLALPLDDEEGEDGEEDGGDAGIGPDPAGQCGTW